MSDIEILVVAEWGFRCCEKGNSITWMMQQLKIMLATCKIPSDEERWTIVDDVSDAGPVLAQSER